MCQTQLWAVVGWVPWKQTLRGRLEGRFIGVPLGISPVEEGRQ